MRLQTALISLILVIVSLIYFHQQVRVSQTLMVWMQIHIAV